jgi:hypothetical protein
MVCTKKINLLPFIPREEINPNNIKQTKKESKKENINRRK